MGLEEKGPRSNGLTLVRRVMEDAHGPEWHRVRHNARTYGDLALEPSTIYSRAVVDMFGGIEGEPRARLHAAAHVTGGGLPGKLGRALKPSGSGAVIDEPFDPPALMLHCLIQANHQPGPVMTLHCFVNWARAASDCFPN